MTQGNNKKLIEKIKKVSKYINEKSRNSANYIVVSSEVANEINKLKKIELRKLKIKRILE